MFFLDLKQKINTIQILDIIKYHHDVGHSIPYIYNYLGSRGFNVSKAYILDNIVVINLGYYEKHSYSKTILSCTSSYLKQKLLTTYYLYRELLCPIHH